MVEEKNSSQLRFSVKHTHTHTTIYYIASKNYFFALDKTNQKFSAVVYLEYSNSVTWLQFVSANQISIYIYRVSWRSL